MNMRLFWDTNIMLDLLDERTPFYEPAAKIATLAEEKNCQSLFQLFLTQQSIIF